MAIEELKKLRKQLMKEVDATIKDFVVLAR